MHAKALSGKTLMTGTVSPAFQYSYKQAMATTRRSLPADLYEFDNPQAQFSGQRFISGKRGQPERHCP